MTKINDMVELRLDQIELLDQVRELLADVAHTYREPEPLLTDVGEMIVRIDRTVEGLR
jgi:hypothetical protein